MAMSHTLNKDMIYLVMQCLAEGGHAFQETLHRLEQESGMHFDMNYFEKNALNGEWNELERYLSGFTNLHENQHSIQIYFEIRKEKYLEALDRQDRQMAAEILIKDLKVFEELNTGIYKELIGLMALDNFRENEFLSGYGDTRTNRVNMVLELKKLIQQNPVFEDKLTFPTITPGRLQSLINQSSNWQQQQSRTETRTLATDHAGLSSNLNLALAPQPVHVPAVPLALPALPYNRNSDIASSSNTANAFTGVEWNQHNHNASPFFVGSSSQDGTGTGTERFIEPQQITEPGQCLVVTMPDNDIIGPAIKIGKLMYTHSGERIWALTTTAVHKVWNWDRNTLIGNVTPLFWEPVPIRNDALEAAVPCLSIAKNDAYLLSACAGNITLVNLRTYERMTFMTPPPAPTFVAFHPHDNHVKIFGMENSVINIYHFSLERPEFQLKGHKKRVTGITFSSVLNLMVSSGADAQIIFWGLDTWERKNSLFLELPGCNVPLQNGDTVVQFHTDQIRILVSHETQLAIYVGSTMFRILQWIPQGGLLLATSLAATFSCDGSMIYAAFQNASIGIFDSYLKMICHIAPNLYIPRTLMRNGGEGPEGIVHSISALDAHPHLPNQFAVGLTNGSIKLIEAKPAGRKWGVHYTGNCESVTSSS